MAFNRAHTSVKAVYPSNIDAINQTPVRKTHSVSRGMTWPHPYKPNVAEYHASSTWL